MNLSDDYCTQLNSQLKHRLSAFKLHCSKDRLLTLIVFGLLEIHNIARALNKNTQQGKFRELHLKYNGVRISCFNICCAVKICLYVYFFYPCGQMK